MSRPYGYVGRASRPAPTFGRQVADTVLAALFAGILTASVVIALPLAHTGDTVPTSRPTTREVTR